LSLAGASVWLWFAVVVVVAGSAFCSGTETALTALGDARARQLREAGGRSARVLGLWIDHPDRLLSTLLIGNTLLNVGAGVLAAALGANLAAWGGLSPAPTVAVVTAVVTVAVLFLGEIVPKTVAKRRPVRVAVAGAPVLQALYAMLWPVTFAVTRFTSRVLSRMGAGQASPSVTGADIEYLIEMGTREGVLDAVKEELLNSVLEFADRVAREIMVPRTRMVAIDRGLPPDELARVVTENPFSRMPVYEGSVDNVVGILIVRELVGELRQGKPIALERYLKPAYFVPEGMKISRLLKEMQRRRTHLAVVVDEFGGTSGLVTLEDVIEEIVGEIQDEADVETAPIRSLAPGQWLADAAVPLHDLESYLNEQPGSAGDGRGPEVHFPAQADYETLGGFVTATAGRVPPVGSILVWDGLVFTVRAGDERRVSRVEIARRVVPAQPDGEVRPPAPAALTTAGS
jgi:CBS domain containing-hemolysin-like protein